MLSWRGLFAGLMTLCVIAVHERRNTWAAIRAIARPGLVAATTTTIFTSTRRDDKEPKACTLHQII
jgi:hypothetical protein